MSERNIILNGDCLEMLKTLPDNSIDCCVTSPPYYALRDYGIDGQIGLEETPEKYIEKMTEVFMEVYRVLKDDGTLWLNIGDSYNGNKNGNTENIKHKKVSDSNNFTKKLWDGAKPKDLIGIPWMLAFSLRNAGWYLRQDIIWHKPNPMPESVTDRCTKSHEYIFLFSKSQKYYFNHEAIQEPAVSSDDLKRRIKNGVEEWKTDKAKNTYAVSGTGRSREELYTINSSGEYVRNKRDVWTVNVKPCKEAHFATYPFELVKPCILAGCPEGGSVRPVYGKWNNRNSRKVS